MFLQTYSLLLKYDSILSLISFFALPVCTSQQWILEQPHSPVRGNFIKVRKSYISTVCLALEVDLHTKPTLTDDWQA
jgi:hypothetical protein